MSLAARTRERLQAAACLVLILALFPGCKGFGALLKVAAVGAYVAARVVVAAAVAGAKSRPPPDAPPDPPPPQAPPLPAPPPCSCAQPEHGRAWCDRWDGQDVCMLQCDAGFVYRDGLCVPAT